MFVLQGTQTLLDLLNIFIAQHAECLNRLLFYNPYTTVALEEFCPQSLHSQHRCWRTVLCGSVLVIFLLCSLQCSQFEGQINWMTKYCRRISKSNRQISLLKSTDRNKEGTTVAHGSVMDHVWCSTVQTTLKVTGMHGGNTTLDSKTLVSPLLEQ